MFDRLVELEDAQRAYAAALRDGARGAVEAAFREVLARCPHVDEVEVEGFRNQAGDVTHLAVRVDFDNLVVYTEEQYLRPDVKTDGDDPDYDPLDELHESELGVVECFDHQAQASLPAFAHVLGSQRVVYMTRREGELKTMP